MTEERPKTVAACLIVKNEGEVIARCLNSVRGLVQAVVIVDTGSTDDTLEVIRNLDYPVPIRLYERPWVNFAHNRSESLRLAAPEADYLLLLEADYTVEGTLPANLTADSYHLLVRTPGIEYPKLLLIRSALPWRFEGVVHEHLACEQAGPAGDLSTPIIRDHVDGGRRPPGWQPRWEWDAEVLEKEVARDPSNTRNVFYLARSYDDLATTRPSDPWAAEWRQKAMARYRERAQMAGYHDEAVILGKTNLCEFGHKGVTDNLLFGTTCNPWDPARTAGGSSGGSGAAVAAGLAYLALGTDIGGSIRVPASCCGIVGLKPSLGRIPRVPVGNYFNPAWAPGPMARTVADTALGLRVLAGPDDRDPYCLPPLRAEELDLSLGVDGLRIAWSPAPIGGPVEPVVIEAARGALAHLEALGARVETLDRVLPVPRQALEVLVGGDVLSGFTLMGITSRWRFWLLRLLGIFSPRRRLSPSFVPFASRAWRTSLPEYIRVQTEITDWVERSAGVFFREFDVLATPTLALPPFPHPRGLGPDRVAGRPVDPLLGWLFTWPFNLTAQPALSVPCGWSTDGLPLGLQLVGHRGEEGVLLRLAAALEQAAPWSGRRLPDRYTRP